MLKSHSRLSNAITDEGKVNYVIVVKFLLFQEDKRDTFIILQGLGAMQCVPYKIITSD